MEQAKAEVRDQMKTNIVAERRQAAMIAKAVILVVIIIFSWSIIAMIIKR
ncbi:hypothetical protein [Sphingomonas sp. CV7422]|nr:hypothetical protein [Sphingomonas sp. CV7422]